MRSYRGKRYFPEASSINHSDALVGNVVVDRASMSDVYLPSMDSIQADKESESRSHILIWAHVLHFLAIRSGVLTALVIHPALIDAGCVPVEEARGS